MRNIKPLLILLISNLAFALSYAQSSQKLNGMLKAALLEKDTTESIWIYNPDKAKIKKIKNPFLNKLITNLVFYKVELKNHSGAKKSDFECLLIYDKLIDSLHVIEPYSFSTKSVFSFWPFNKVILNNETTIKIFFKEIQKLMLTGTNAKFENTNYIDNKVTFDLTLPTINNIKVSKQFIITISNNLITRSEVNTSTTGQKVFVPYSSGQ